MGDRRIAPMIRHVERLDRERLLVWAHRFEIESPQRRATSELRAAIIARLRASARSKVGSHE